MGRGVQASGGKEGVVEGGRWGGGGVESFMVREKWTQRAVARSHAFPPTPYIRNPKP